MFEAYFCFGYHANYDLFSCFITLPELLRPYFLCSSPFVHSYFVCCLIYIGTNQYQFLNRPWD